MTLVQRFRVALIALMTMGVTIGASALPGSVASAITTPTLTLSASPNPAPSGTPVNFTATLSGGDNPTGDISVAGYTSSNCSDPTPAFSFDATVNGNGDYTLGPATPAPGTYYGEAYYSGDSNNAPASSGSCDQILVVNAPLAMPTLTLSASPNPAPSGTPVNFTATLSGGSNPTGDISVAGYTSSNCSDPTPAFSFDATVNGNGDYTLGPATPAPGTYYGEAYYTGDSNNAPASSGSCDQILVVNSQSGPTSPWWWWWWWLFLWFLEHFFGSF